MQKIKKLALETLFPKQCVGCGQEGYFVCQTCFKTFKLLNFQVCPQCEKFITDKGTPCQRCAHNRPPLASLLAAVRYRENHLNRLVHLMKYNFAAEISHPLGSLLTGIILKNDMPVPDLIIPVPLHMRRLRWRGFNQAELLAQQVSENMAPGFPIQVSTDAIRRKKYTPPQMKIGTFAERRINVRGIFVPGKDIGLITGKKILLIDDICTTGATLSECAHVLKMNGAKKIFAAVLARQEFENK